jgi:hypothetical protein
VSSVSHHGAVGKARRSIDHRVSPVQRVRDAVAASGAAQRPGRAVPQEPGAADVAAGGRPWHYAKHVSAHLDTAADIRVTRRHVRYAQREVLWRESTLERVRKCGRVTVGGSGHVMIRSNAGVAHYAGLTTCGSIWACPVCSAKIRNTRATEISEATAAWDRAGNSVYMVTFTAPHDMGMKLRPLMSAIADGFRAVIAGRAWITLRKRLGIVGTIRAMEVTYGEHGWHPHLHVLVYVSGQLDARQLADLAVHARKRWGDFIVKAGYRMPHGQHGVNITRCSSAEDAGQYVAKTQDGRAVGNEMTRADLKQGRAGGRTPFEILDDFRWTGDDDDRVLWREYEWATKGRQAITWSKGLRQLLAITERTDEEIAAEEIGGEDLAVIHGDDWRRIVRIPGLTGLILDQVERGGLPAVNELLALHSAGQAHLPVMLQHLE